MFCQSPQSANCANKRDSVWLKILLDICQLFATVHHKRLTQDYLFQQDSAGPHRPQVITGKRRRLPSGRRVKLLCWFLINCIHQIVTPSHAPDLSLIEYLWALIKQQLSGRRVNSHDEVWDATLEAWNSISAPQLMKLVESMPRRLEAVIKANGGPTKY